MQTNVKEAGLDLLGLLIIAVVVFLIVNDGRSLVWDWEEVPPVLTNFKVMFLSILIEAFPFILLGVFVSSVIQVFISEDMVKRLVPRNVFLSSLLAGGLGIIFPVCECAIIPVVRRLLLKGMPLHAGIIFMLSAPIINPVVFLSTKTAFKAYPEVALYRTGLAYCVAVVIGLLAYFLFQKQQVMHPVNSLHHHHHVPLGGWQRLKSMFNHAADEIFDMGKFLIFGAFLAALAQTFVARETLLGIGQSEWSAQAVMMGMAYLLSLCSEADAFVAASFSTTFTFSALLGFLVYGPMIDLKNTFMLFSVFKARFVIILIVLITIFVFAGSLFAGRVLG